jgi:phosphoglycerate dehydrogenase-like enzyme
MATRVVVLDDYQRLAPSMLSGPGLDGIAVESFGEHVADEDELCARLSGAEIVVAMRERTALPARVLERLGDLRLLITTGPFNAVIDLEAASRLGICVSGTGGMVTPTSELAWGLIFAVLRHIPAEAERMRSGGWQSTVGRDAFGRTLGLLGAGRLGKLVARAAPAFGMPVIAWSQNLTAKRAADVGAELVSKEELFERADVLSIHLVLSERTRGLVGESELRSMKPTSILINTSRGPIVDEGALLQALREGWIAGAGLDVFDVEPLPPDHPLRRAPNTVLTPHLGYVSQGSYDIFYREIGEDIRAYVSGSPIRVLNPGWGEG